jgi:hypothetical protein
VALSWRAAKISLCSKCIPIGAAADGQLRGAISNLAYSLRNDLKNPGQIDREPWTIAQAVVAVKGTDEHPETAPILMAFRELAERGCDCWREVPTHYLDPKPTPGAPAVALRRNDKSADKPGGFPLSIVATGWILLAQASLAAPPSPKTLRFLVSEQHPDGWWAIFPVARDAKFASIYGTCWALLGLKSQLSTSLVPRQYTPAIEAAIERGTRWLLETRQKARWRFYPNLAQRSTDSESLSGLALHTLHEISDGKLELKQIDRDWINELPGAPPPPGEAESQLLWVDSKEGRSADHYQQIKLPWLIIATVDAYPNGTLWERARALYWFERALEQTSLREAHSHPDNWWRSELLYALNYLQARVSQ